MYALRNGLLHTCVMFIVLLGRWFVNIAFLMSVRLVASVAEVAWALSEFLVCHRRAAALWPECLCPSEIQTLEFEPQA